MAVYEFGSPGVLGGSLDEDVNGEILSVNNFSVTNADAQDSFEFYINPSFGYERLQLFLHDISGGDADLRLFDDNNNNGTYDAGDVLLASSTRAGTQSETINFDVSSTTGYVVAEVYRFSGSPINYDLDVVAIEADPLTADPFGLSIGDSLSLSGTVEGTGAYIIDEAAETYALDIIEAGIFSADVDVLAGGNPVLSIYDDSNSNGIFDSEDLLIAESMSGAISFEADAGLMFGQVLRPASQSADIDYALNVNLEAVDPLTGLDDVVYRFFNASVGYHFYTTDTFERDFIIGNLPTFAYEGPSFKVSNTPAPDLLAVHRFYNTALGNHFYTTNTVERDFIIDNLGHYDYEGIAYHVLGSDAGVGTDVHRFFNSATGAHFFTPSIAERDSVIANLPNYTYEGTAFEVAPL